MAQAWLCDVAPGTVPQLPAGHADGHAWLCVVDAAAVPHVPEGQELGQAWACEVAPAVEPQVPAGHENGQAGLAEVDPVAAQIGAVNTVVIARDGHTTGHNTDRSGFRLSFEVGPGRAAAEGQTAVLVGAGGAGSAVAFALMDLGLKTLIVHDQDKARATALTASVIAHFGASRCRLSERLIEDIAGAEGVANATPIGMAGFPGNPVPPEALRPHPGRRHRHRHGDAGFAPSPDRDRAAGADPVPPLARR